MGGEPDDVDGPPAAPDEAAVDRPETDDYDLLTFGEVAARIDEELAQMATELERARAAPRPDAGRIQALEERMAHLKGSGERYRREGHTNEFFKRRFGTVAAPSADQRPQWR